MDLDTELGYQLALSKTLEKELPKCALMSERVLVRKEIRECKRRIKEILQEQKAEQDDKDNTNNTFTSDDRMYDTENNVLENNQ